VAEVVDSAAGRHKGQLLTRAQIIDALQPLLPTIDRLRGRVMVVGTASCALAGIDLPTGDVDFLAFDRDAVDELAKAAEEAGFTALVAPGWLAWTPDSGQYFARSALGDVWVEFSTVEVGGKQREIEAWRRSGVVHVDDVAIQSEALEARLATELARNRPDRWVPIASHLARRGYDRASMRSAIAELTAFQLILNSLAAEPAAATGMDRD